MIAPPPSAPEQVYVTPTVEEIQFSRITADQIYDAYLRLKSRGIDQPLTQQIYSEVIGRSVVEWKIEAGQVYVK